MTNRRRALLATLPLLVPLAACGRGSALMEPPAPPRAAARVAEDLDRLFAERVNAGDLDGLMALYERTATLLREDGTAIVGAAAIREELGGILGGGLRISINVIRLAPPSGVDVVLLYDDWTAVGTGPNGKPIRLSGRANEVARRQRDGTWRFVIDDPYARSRRWTYGESHPYAMRNRRSRGSSAESGGSQSSRYVRFHQAPLGSSAGTNS
jgi:ketosteroid isomerase-like protein